jgi:rare lipoprotein A
MRRLAPHTLLLGLLGCLACGSQHSAERSRVIAPDTGYGDHDRSEGRATFYARSLAGHKTASGEPYDPTRLTAAHSSLPLGAVVRVTRLPGGPSVEVRINDRCGCQHGRLIDLSEAAARKLDMIRAGSVPVRIEVLVR